MWSIVEPKSSLPYIQKPATLIHSEPNKLSPQLHALLSAFAKLRKETPSFVVYVCPSVRPSGWNNSAHTKRNFMKFVEKIQVSLKCNKNNGYYTGRPTYILIISRSVLLRMRSVSEKAVQKIKTQILGSMIFFLSKIVWKNTVQPGRPQMTIRRMRFACWVTKATDTHLE